MRKPIREMTIAELDKSIEQINKSLEKLNALKVQAERNPFFTTLTSSVSRKGDR